MEGAADGQIADCVTSQIQSITCELLRTRKRGLRVLRTWRCADNYLHNLLAAQSTGHKTVPQESAIHYV